MYENIEKPERAIAVSVVKKGFDRDSANEHLKELSFLAETAGAEVIETIYQELSVMNPATLIGKGKLEELKREVEENKIILVIFDDDLSPAQNRNLETELQVKVIDRSGLILDIFAKRAKTVEAKTQVELAQLQYLLPRLTGMWTHLSKQYGGIRTKGPGETQIETDRRLVRQRIQSLKLKLTEIEVYRELQRKGRDNIPKFALVGYTNAGKSTLMNTLTGSSVYIENKLFATLDTTVRSFNLPGGKKALLSDTVGFIRKLPAHLIASFKSTLAEAREADILIHVVDIANKDFRVHIGIVSETLSSIQITDIPTIIAFNKVDLIEDFDDIRGLKNEFSSSIFISAERRLNVQALLNIMKEKLDESSKIVRLIMPYSDLHLISKLYAHSEVLNMSYEDAGVEIMIKIQPDNFDYIQHSFSRFII